MTSGGCSFPLAAAMAASTPPCRASVTSRPEKLRPEACLMIWCFFAMTRAPGLLERVRHHAELVDARLLHGRHDLHHVAVQEVLVGVEIELVVGVELGVVLEHLLDV